MSDVKEFRFSAKTYGFTYSQVPESWTNEFMLKTLSTRVVIDKYVIGTERHKDTGKHIHAFLALSTVFRGRDQSYFDIDLDGEPSRFHPKGFVHPNIKPLKGKHIDNFARYCQKDGNFIKDLEIKLDLTTPVNYLKRKRDFEAWTQDTRDVKHIKETVHKEVEICGKKHVFKGKTGNLLLHGPPNKYKTTMICGSFDADENWHPGVLDPSEYFLIIDPRHPYEGWNGQKYIIYDDANEIDWDHIKQVGEQKPIPVRMPGTQRYNSVVRPAYMKLYVVVIINNDRLSKEKQRIPHGIIERFSIIEAS